MVRKAFYVQIRVLSLPFFKGFLSIQLNRIKVSRAATGACHSQFVEYMWFEQIFSHKDVFEFSTAVLAFDFPLVHFLFHGI